MIQAADNTIRICESHARSLFIGEGEKRAGDVATYLAHVGAGLTMREIARVQGRQPSTVMRAVRRVNRSAMIHFWKPPFHGSKPITAA